MTVPAVNTQETDSLCQRSHPGSSSSSEALRLPAGSQDLTLTLCTSHLTLMDVVANLEVSDRQAQELNQELWPQIQAPLCSLANWQGGDDTLSEPRFP